MGVEEQRFRSRHDLGGFVRGAVGSAYCDGNPGDRMTTTLSRAALVRLPELEGVAVLSPRLPQPAMGGDTRRTAYLF